MPYDREFVFSEMMPKLKYLTLLDYYVFGNVTFVFLVCIQLTIVEILKVNTEENVTDNLTVGNLILIVNMVGWFALVAIFLMIAGQIRQTELLKLGKMPGEKEWTNDDGEPQAFKCNMFCGGSSRCLMLEHDTNKLNCPINL